jgi:hypothetical protein
MHNFKEIVVALFKVEMFVGVLIVPFILIRAIVLYSHADPESRMRARHLLVIVAELLLALVILPPLVGVVASILPTASIQPAGSSGDLDWADTKAPGPGWIFTLLFSLLSWLVTGFEAFVKNYLSFLTIPIISLSENLDLFTGGLFGGEASSKPFTLMDDVWKVFFAIAMAIILLSIGYNFLKDVIQEATGEESGSERGGAGVMVYLGRALTGVVLAFVSYPIGKALFYLDYVIKTFMMVRVTFPGLKLNINVMNAEILQKSQITNAIVYMTLTPHTKQFAKALGLMELSDPLITLTDPYQAILVGALVSYSMVFLIAMAAIFAMRIIMVTFWFGIAPVVFATAGSFKGKLSSMSSWFTHFMTWTFFPSAVSVILYIVGSVVSAIPNIAEGTFADIKYYFMLFIFFAGMTVILKVPGILERLFSGIGNTIENTVGSVISGIQRVSGL